MGLYDSAKNVAKVLQEAGKIPEYQTILELLDDSLKNRVEIDNLKTEIAELKRKSQVSENYIFKNNFYYHKETSDGPYCPRCCDKNKELIRAIPTYIGSDLARCPECKNEHNFTGVERN